MKKFTDSKGTSSCTPKLMNKTVSQLQEYTSVMTLKGVSRSSVNNQNGNVTALSIGAPSLCLPVLPRRKQFQQPFPEKRPRIKLRKPLFQIIEVMIKRYRIMLYIRS